MDKININSQSVLKMSSFSMGTRSMSSSPLVNSLIKNRLFKTAPDIDEPHYRFVSGRHDAAWQPRSRNPQDWDLGCLEATCWAQESLAFLDAAVQLLHVCGAVCRYTVLLEQSRYQTLLRVASSSITSLWRREAASKKSVRDITRISGFVTTMKLPHALQIYLTVSVKKCMWLHFQGSAATNYR